MAEDTAIRLSNEDQSMGSIKIAPQVLEFIAGIAASQVDGVSRMHGTFANNVGEMLGRSDYRRGVHLTIEDDHSLTFDVAVYVDYGKDVPQVAAEIQNKIKQQVALMIDLKVGLVNVYIQGITPTKNDQEIDPNDIFGQDENESEDSK